MFRTARRSLRRPLSVGAVASLLIIATTLAAAPATAVGTCTPAQMPDVLATADMSAGMTGTTQLTDASGVATVTSLTMGPVKGCSKILATATMPAHAGLTGNPFMFYGFIVAPVMVAGLAGLIGTRRKAAWYLAVIALGQMIALGLQTHAQPRYVFLPSAALFITVISFNLLGEGLRARWSGR